MFAHNRFCARLFLFRRSRLRLRNLGFWLLWFLRRLGCRVRLTGRRRLLVCSGIRRRWRLPPLALGKRDTDQNLKNKKALTKKSSRTSHIDQLLHINSYETGLRFRLYRYSQRPPAARVDSPPAATEVGMWFPSPRPNRIPRNRSAIA